MSQGNNVLCKAQELFDLCDNENKGFITKRDMWRLKSQISLDVDQLEQVFDSLDNDASGYLTLDEFAHGFGSFLGEDFNAGDTLTIIEEPPKTEEHDDEEFLQMLDNVGAHAVFQERGVIKTMWADLKKYDPTLVCSFEKLLSDMTQEVKRTKADHCSLTEAMRNKAESHDQQVKRLYEEMEIQIKEEKERIILQERKREKLLKEEMDKQLKIKEAQVEQLLLSQAELTSKLSSLTHGDSETKHENIKLLRERDKLAREMRKQEVMINELQETLQGIQTKRKMEQRERAKAALTVTEGIAMEREGLVRQLDLLRSINSHLRDEHDELLHIKAVEDLTGSQERMSDILRDADVDGIRHQRAEAQHNIGLELSTAAGHTSDYHSSLSSQSPSGLHSLDTEPSTKTPGESSEFECDDEYVMQATANIVSDLLARTEKDGRKQTENTAPKICIENAATEPLTSARSPMLTRSPQLEESESSSAASSRRTSPCRNKPYLANFHQAVDDGSNSVADSDGSSNGSIDSDLYLRPRKIRPSKGTRRRQYSRYNGQEAIYKPTERRVVPQDIFKIIFIGDSNVGKTAFIHRFCHGAFAPSYNNTIGVDFRCRSVTVEERLVCLQLWDTAGQERFRSITQQFYRKADGVVVFYDVTSEMSYKNLLGWIESIKERTTGDCLLIVVGNKVDLCTQPGKRVVSTEEGKKMAEDAGALFFETSAVTGQGVEEAIMEMASILEKKQHDLLEKAANLQLTVKPNKKKCC